MKIVIIGAGISGLTTAATLKHSAASNFEVAIYERDQSKDSRPQGHAIGLDQRYALFVLRSLGLSESIIQQEDSKKLSSLVFQDQNGKELLSFKNNSAKEMAYRVQRQSLKISLTQAIGDIPIHYDHEAIEFKNTKDQIELIFSNGKKITADYVIACDGSSSKIRQFLLNDDKHFLGLISISGISANKENYPCLDGGYYMGLGNDGSSLFIYHQPEGIYYSYTFSETDPAVLVNKEKSELLQFVIDKTKSWCPMVRDIVATTDPLSMHVRPYYDRHPIQKMHYNKVWLIGDAAHPMSPFRGLGGNLAMIDAYELASLLTKLTGDKNKDNKMIDCLEKKLVQRGKKAILESRNKAKSLHESGKFALISRYAIFWLYRCMMKFMKT